MLKYILSIICETLIRQLLIGMSDIFQIDLIDYILIFSSIEKKNANIV